MNSAKSRIGAGDIVAGGHACLCSSSGTQRLASAHRHEYGVAWAAVEKRGTARSELVKQQIFLITLAGEVVSARPRGTSVYPPRLAVKCICFGPSQQVICRSKWLDYRQN